MATFNEIKTRVFSWLTNRLLPESATTGQVAVKQGDGTWAGQLPEKGVQYVTATGTNDYAATITGLLSYATPLTLAVKFTNANTAACTFNINSLGAKDIVRSGNVPLVSGIIPSGAVFILTYDGANFQMTAYESLPTYLGLGEKALSITSGGVQKNYDITAPPGVDIGDLQSATWTNDECTGIAGYNGQTVSDSGYNYTCTDSATGKWSRFPRVMPSTGSGEKAITVTPGGLQASYTVTDVTAADVTDLQNATWTGNKCTGVAGFEGQMASDNDYIYYCYDVLGYWLRIENNKMSLEKRIGSYDDSGGVATNADLETDFPTAVIGQEVKGSVIAGKFNLYTKEASGTWTYYEITNC